MALSNTSNHFLASLPPEVLAMLQPQLVPVDLPNTKILYHAGDKIDRMYFPVTGVISLLVGLSDGQMVEAGMLGRNSVVGAAAALDKGEAINQAIVQVGGSGYSIETRAMRNLVDQYVVLRTTLASHEQMMTAHTQQVAACNTFHELEARLSRWLLQTRDLIASETLPLTQEFLAQMLGVSRSSVTLVAKRLQQSGLISYRRGNIQLVDIEGLQETCCECYDAINAHFHRLSGWKPDHG